MGNLLKNCRHILCANKRTHSKKQQQQQTNIVDCVFDSMGDRKHAFHHKHRTIKAATTTVPYTHNIREASCKNRVVWQNRCEFFLCMRSLCRRYLVLQLNSQHFIFYFSLAYFFFSIFKQKKNLQKNGVCSLNSTSHEHTINENHVSALLDAFNFCFIVSQRSRCFHYIEN